jgi:hypothetical protein
MLPLLKRIEPLYPVLHNTTVFGIQFAEIASLHSILPNSTMENSKGPSSSTPPGQQPQYRRYTRSELIDIFHAYNHDITIDEVYSRMMAKGHYKETEPGSDLYVMVSLEEFLTHYGIPPAEGPASSLDVRKSKNKHSNS